MIEIQDSFASIQALNSRMLLMEREAREPSQNIQFADKLRDDGYLGRCKAGGDAVKVPARHFGAARSDEWPKGGLGVCSSISCRLGWMVGLAPSHC